ncbi:hypothetical protein ACLOJK_002884 [Asimina triloba]
MVQKRVTESKVTACGQDTPRKDKSIRMVTMGAATSQVMGKSLDFSLETPMTPITMVGGGGQESSSSGNVNFERVYTSVYDGCEARREHGADMEQECGEVEVEFKDDVAEGSEAKELDTPNEVLIGTSEADFAVVKARVVAKKEIGSSSGVIRDSSKIATAAGSLKLMVDKAL